MAVSRSQSLVVISEKSFQVFIHTSTAYTNTDKPVVEEIVYPPPAALNDVYAFLKQADEEQGSAILSK